MASLAEGPSNHKKARAKKKNTVPSEQAQAVIMQIKEKYNTFYYLMYLKNIYTFILNAHQNICFYSTIL